MRSPNSLTFKQPSLLPCCSLLRAGGDSWMPWSSGPFRFFDICRSPVPVMDRCAAESCVYLPVQLLIARDTFNPRDIKHIQESWGSEIRDARKFQPHSFRSRLCCEPLSARKVAEHRPSGHLETRWGMEPISSCSYSLIIGQDDFTGLSTAYFPPLRLLLVRWDGENLQPKRFCGSRVSLSDYVWTLVRWKLRTDCNLLIRVY